MYISIKSIKKNKFTLIFRSKSQVYIGLPGCLQDFDKIAAKFLRANNVDDKKQLLSEAESLWNKAKGNRENKSAETYVKVS